MVGFDSIIPPGREGKITPEVNIANGHAGVLQKYVTVYSNAKNTPEQRISIRCTILTELDADPRYLSLKPDKTGLVRQIITLTSPKKDLEVKEVIYTENKQNTGNSNSWQAALSLRFSHTLAKTPEAPVNGSYKYLLTISLSTTGTTATYGEFVIKTNHPKKSELKLSGTILEPEK